MSELKMVLFDLDGTLLPMDLEQFTNGYFRLLAAKLAPYGYEPKKLVESVWTGTEAMVRNDGSATNEEAFWTAAAKSYGEKINADRPLFDEFYQSDFQKAKEFCGFSPDAVHAVQEIREMGLRVALATNPIFPAIATETRIRWAGLSPEDFEIYTTYENSRFSKPNPKYYSALAEKLSVSPSQCLMVGNDAMEDLAAEKIGMRVFLLTDCLINKKGIDLSAYPSGGFAELLNYVRSLTGQLV